jgi:hypothetical protein
MISLPVLSDWHQTAHSLHAAAQLLGAIRQLVREPVENYLELAMRIESNGLSTERLPSGGTVFLDFERAAIVYTPKPGELVNDTPLTVDITTSANYGRALYRVFTAIARFRARLAGPQT